jgi:hypothetical protein
VALSAGARDEAIDRLLSAAAEAPSDPEVLELLDSAAAEHPLRREPPYGALEWGYRAIRPHLPQASAEWGFVLYALPEFQRCDSELLPDVEPMLRFSSRQVDNVFLSTPERLGPLLPLHTPISRDPYVWQPPQVLLRGGVLIARQGSRYDELHGGSHYETSGLCVYRVRGALFHARYLRYGYWSAGDTPWLGGT